MAEEVSRAARAVREGLDALRLRASRWGAPRPRFWIDERTTKSCFECGVAFSLVTRKHHCRACGRVFCQKCSSHALPPRDDPEGPPERACDVCFASHADKAEPLRVSTSSAKKRVSARSPRVPDPALSRVASERLAGSSPTSSVSSRPASASASRRASTGPAGSADDSDSDSESDEDASESDASDDDADAVVSDANLSDGAADVRTRRGARHPASPLETRWTPSTRARDRSETGTETEAEAETPSERPARRTSPRRYRAGKPLYAAHAAHAAALADETMWAPPPPGLEPGMRSTAGSTLSDAPVNAAILGLAARFLRRDARSSSESKNETDAFVDTWTRFVAALALECARAVEPSRFAFSETSKSPSGSDPRRKPDDARRDRYDMDPLSYVSIRRAAAGAPSSSSLARDAWSLRRNVADRRMAKRRGVVSSTSAETLARRHFPDPAHPRDPRDEFSAATEFSAREPRTATFHKEPRSNDDDGDDGEDGDASPAVRVALLGGALEYQRATDAPRLASFSTLLDQEHEHLRASAARALVSKPDVALVERTVARFARDLFLERGVSLAIGVGLEELRRLAFRFAPSEYSWSRSALAADGGAVRGTCAGWSVETLEETLRDETSDDETETETHARRSVSPTTTSYMTFHGLAPGSGCVLTLRGGSTSALAAVESATKKSARAAYHLDRVAAFVKTAASSHVGQSSKASSQAKVDRFVYALLRKSVETEFTNATVQIVSRAFCPARVASVACDPPVGFRSTFPEKKLDKDKIPFLEIVPYGPEDLPLGAALAQAVRAERGLTECPHAKCGEHPAAHVRVFYVAGGKVTLRARRREKHEKNFFGISNQKEKGDDFFDAFGGWTYWSRCRSCLPEETRTDTSSFVTREEHGDAKRHFPFATPAFGSASPVAAPKRALELSLARFLELVGADVPEAVFDGLDASRLDGDCVHASPRDRAHYFASTLGTVCFAFDETSPLALVVSPARDSPSSARFEKRDLATERKTASSARFDARCAAAAAALRRLTVCPDARAFARLVSLGAPKRLLWHLTHSKDVATRRDCRETLRQLARDAAAKAAIQAEADAPALASRAFAKSDGPAGAAGDKDETKRMEALVPGLVVASARRRPKEEVRATRAKAYRARGTGALEVRTTGDT
mmetsp:Transcript_8218/g.34871  ORF Transcript_8218/g.34871 Transcript_8218/m.34871 type:complete len:1149 (-) Transcript_8218:91-3537(-)